MSISIKIIRTSKHHPVDAHSDKSMNQNGSCCMQTNTNSDHGIVQCSFVD